MADMNDKMSDMKDSAEEKAKDTMQKMNDNATDRMEQMRRENAEHSANEE